MSNGVAMSTYARNGDVWKIDVVLPRNDGTESKKRKTLRVEGDLLSIKNESAPLPEFLQLDFKRDASGQD